MRILRFFMARTDHFATARATFSVFGMEGVAEIDAFHVGQSDQPGHDVGELFAFIGLVLSFGDSRGKFAHFFHEPEEGPGGTSPAILVRVHTFDEVLKIAEVHIRQYNRGMMAEPDPRLTLLRSVRLRTRMDFDRVFAARRSAGDACIRLYAQDNAVGYARVGLAVGRRYGNAVRRNRIKRLLREAFRHVRHTLPPADYIILPLPGAEPSVAQLQNSIRRLADKLARGRQAEERQGEEKRIWKK